MSRHVVGAAGPVAVCHRCRFVRAIRREAQRTQYSLSFFAGDERAGIQLASRDRGIARGLSERNVGYIRQNAAAAPGPFLLK